MGYQCTICGREFEKLQSLGGHSKWCNPATRPDHTREKNPMWGKKARNQWSDVDLAQVPFEKLGHDRRRKFLLKEANNACTRCSFSETRADGTIILQIDHIDGNRANNARENLRVLCPNCHAVHSLKFMHIGQKHSEETKNRLRRRISSVS